jgi:hypothetical protein
VSRSGGVEISSTRIWLGAATGEGSGFRHVEVTSSGQRGHPLPILPGDPSRGGPSWLEVEAESPGLLLGASGGAGERGVQVEVVVMRPRDRGGAVRAVVTSGHVIEGKAAPWPTGTRCARHHNCCGGTPAQPPRAALTPWRRTSRGPARALEAWASAAATTASTPRVMSPEELARRARGADANRT